MEDTKKASIKQIASMKNNITQKKKGDTDFAVSIEKSSLIIKKQAALLKENILKFFAPTVPEAKPETPSVADAIKDAAEKTGGVGLDIFKLALLLPLVMNDKVKALVGGFFKSFMEKLGVAKPIIDGIAFAINNLEYIVGAFFGFKIWKSVKGAFDAIMQLARVTGMVAESTATQAAVLDTDKKTFRDEKGRLRDEKGRFVSEKKELEDGVKKAGDSAKTGIKEAKKDMKDAKKLGKLNFLGKFKVLKEKVVPKLLSLGQNFLKSIPGVGTLIGIGLILYDLWSIGSDIYDVFLGGDEEEAKQEKKATPAASPVKGPAAGARGAPPVAAARPPAATTAASNKAPAPSGASATSPASSAAQPAAGATATQQETAPAAVPAAPAESAPAISSVSQELIHNEEMSNVTQISVTNIDNSKNTSIAASNNKQPAPPSVYFTLLA